MSIDFTKKAGTSAWGCLQSRLARIVVRGASRTTRGFSLFAFSSFFAHSVPCAEIPPRRMARGDPNEDAVLCEGQADIVDLDGAPRLGCSAEGNAHGRRSRGRLCRDTAVVAEIAGCGRERTSRYLYHESVFAACARHKDDRCRKGGVGRCGVCKEREIIMSSVHRRRDILRQCAAV